MPENYRTYLLKRFPYLETAFDRRLRESAEFRGICHDFADAADALASWEDSLEPGAAKKAREYRKLVRNLEADVLHELYRNDNS